jgi:hypothetical protein
MTAVPRVPLPEFFRSFSPIYVLGTTYTVSLAFFEGRVLPEIDTTQLRRCLLLCDRVGFQRALVEASALRCVGRDYMAVCAPAVHTFHPKVWFMIGADEAALLVGSGNLTQSRRRQLSARLAGTRTRASRNQIELASSSASCCAGVRIPVSPLLRKPAAPITTPDATIR